MKRKNFIICTLLFLVCFIDLYANNIKTSDNQKSGRGLAIIGDAWHPAAYLYRSIVKQMEEKGIKTDVIYDYDVPFDKLEYQS